MKTIITLTTFLIVQAFAFAGNGKNLVVRVYLLGTHQPLKGIKISGVDKNSNTLFNSTSDSTGTILFSGIEIRKFNLNCIDPSGEYASLTREVMTTSQDTLFIKLRYNKAKENELIKRKTMVSPSDTVKGKKWDCVEQTSAEYQGGIKGISTYVMENLEYPEDAILEGTKGKVYVAFKVDTIGELKSIRVLKGVDKTLDDCAIRTLVYMPNWSPGKCNGKLVDSYYTLPFVFAFSRRGK